MWCFEFFFWRSLNCILTSSNFGRYTNNPKCTFCEILRHNKLIWKIMVVFLFTFQWNIQWTSDVPLQSIRNRVFVWQNSTIPRRFWQNSAVIARKKNFTNNLKNKTKFMNKTQKVSKLKKIHFEKKNNR